MHNVNSAWKFESGFKKSVNYKNREVAWLQCRRQLSDIVIRNVFDRNHLYSFTVPLHSSSGMCWITCPVKCGMKFLILSKFQRRHRWSLGMDKCFHPTLKIGGNPHRWRVPIMHRMQVFPQSVFGSANHRANQSSCFIPKWVLFSSPGIHSGGLFY